jgi:hypothetical protein
MAVKKLLAFTRLIGLLRQAPLLAVQTEQMVSNPVREAAGSIARTVWYPGRQFTGPTITQYARSWRFI